MTHASLFSGIGGPEIAAAMMGWENIFHCEINPFGRAILDYWFPNSESYEHITKTDFTKYRGKISVLTGGFPCQPFSYGGKRAGQADDRYLWPEMLRVIDEVRPTWVVGENVAGITTMVESCEITDMGGEASLFEEDNGVHRFRAEYAFTIERICRDLESKGYSVQPMLIPACAVGAPHRRDRVFIIAHSFSSGSESHTQDGRAESNRCNELSQPGKWREQTEFDNGFSALSRPADNAHCSNDMREPGEHESESGEEWVSERNSVWELGESDNVPSEVPALASDSECCGRRKMDKYLQSQQSDGGKPKRNGGIRDAADSVSERLERQDESRSSEGGERMHIRRDFAGCCGTHGEGLRPEERWRNFPSVSPVHRGNDGLPFDVDRLTLSFGKWRTEALKAYGNAIVPQVMYEIFRAIEIVEQQNNEL